MNNNNEVKFYETRVIPFMRYEKKIKNGKPYEVAIDNFSLEERENLSCEPQMFRKVGNHQYIAEMPLTFRGGTSIKGFLCYVFKDLTEEEQVKYFDRSIVIQTTIPEVVKVYDDNSKTLFGKRKVKERK